MKIPILLLLLLTSANVLPMDGDEENKVQEKALTLAIDHGKDSPEVDVFLDENKLKEEEMDYADDEDIED
jgi:hypothetical protein